MAAPILHPDAVEANELVTLLTRLLKKQQRSRERQGLLAFARS